MFAIEVNHATGRSDWEAIGRAGTQFENQAAVIEFKHVPKARAAALGVMDWTDPPAEAVEQVEAYAASLLRRYPALSITRHVVCSVSATEHRLRTLG